MSAAQQDVFRLDVAVHDTLLVGVGQRVGHFFRQSGGCGDRETTFPLQSLPQGLAFDVGHYEIGQRRAGPIVYHSGVEDGKDVGMLQAGSQLDLAEEALATLGAAQLGPDDLERHGTLVPQIAGEIDRSHAARADLALEQVSLTQGGRETLMRNAAHGTGNLSRLNRILCRSDRRRFRSHDLDATVPAAPGNLDGWPTSGLRTEALRRADSGRPQQGPLLYRARGRTGFTGGFGQSGARPAPGAVYNRCDP
jgi:hypothetical protein